MSRKQINHTLKLTYAKHFYKLTYKTTEHISLESLTETHTFQNTYDIRFLKCIYIHIKEMCGVSYMHVVKRRCMSKYQVPGLRKLENLCIFTMMFLGSPALSVLSLSLSLYLYHYLLFCLCLYIYLFISDYFSLHLFLCLDLSLSLLPPPCPFPLLNGFSPCPYTHKLAQELILDIMTCCWAKYRHLLPLLSTQREVPFFST